MSDHTPSPMPQVEAESVDDDDTFLTLLANHVHLVVSARTVADDLEKAIANRKALIAHIDSIIAARVATIQAAWDAEAALGAKYKEMAWDAASQAAPAKADGWMPIETAPKDGTDVLLYLGAPWDQVEKARWFYPWKNWQRSGDMPRPDDEYCGIGSAVPTHWMPLPAAPSTPSGEQKS